MPPAQEPYLGGGHMLSQEDHRFPTKPFDPKAVTRASWEPQRKKPPKKDGPLLSFNRHPDTHMPVSYRSADYKVMSDRTKQWIVGIRWVQLGLRVLQLIAALGVLALMILITDVSERVSWLLRLLSGLAAMHCVYGIYHLARPAGGRTPQSTSAYQLFSALCDLCVVFVYAYGVIVAEDKSSEWATLLDDASLTEPLITALYYTLITDSAVHAVTLLISVWLCVMFRKITLMPPDMNPLERHLTSRARHKKARSSTSTAYTNYSGTTAYSAANAVNRESVHDFDEVHRGPTVPFHYTRARSSISSRNRDSRLDLPSQGHQMTPVGSPRNSAYSLSSKRDSMPVGRSSNRGSYVGVPMEEHALEDFQPTGSPRSSTQPRKPKFTETWTASESLIARTQNRNRAMAAQEREREGRAYEALTERYNSYGDSDSETEGNVDILAGSDFDDDPAERPPHPNPLASNPSTPPRQRTPYYPTNVLSETSLNKRNVSGSEDITDRTPTGALKAEVIGQRYRNSLIQPEADFLAKPYGDLKAGTPPVMVGSSRQVSSGNDYHANGGGAYGRRSVSGKVVEEGRAGRSNGRFSLFGH